MTDPGSSRDTGILRSADTGVDGGFPTAIDSGIPATDVGFPVADSGFPTADGGDAAIDGGGAVVGPYPPGPYGSQVGDTVENLGFAGYFSEDPVTGTSMTYSTDIDFQQVRELAEYRYMLVSLAAEWASGSRAEATVLANRFTAWASRGGYVFTVIVQDSLLQPATQQTLDTWRGLYPINYTLVHDPNDVVERVFAPAGIPVNYHHRPRNHGHLAKRRWRKYRRIRRLRGTARLVRLQRPQPEANPLRRSTRQLRTVKNGRSLR